MKKTFSLLLGFFACGLLHAQNIYTLAGGIRVASGLGDGEICRNASVRYPIGLATDTSGNLFVSDYLDGRIRKIGTNCIINTIAGNGGSSHTKNNVPATSTYIHTSHISTDRFGNIFLCDEDLPVIRKISASGIISVFAGDTLRPPGYTGDGGPATLATINGSTSTCSDDSGNVYISDYGANVIRKVNTSGIISTFAGNGAVGYSGDGGLATSAAIGTPRAIAIDHSGYLYVGEQWGAVIRKISLSTRIITTYAGTGTGGYSGDGGSALSAEISAPMFMTFDKFNNLYLNCDGSHFIRKIDNTGIITTIVGNDTGALKGDGGPAVDAELNLPQGVAVDPSGGVLYIADMSNHRIRMVLTCASAIATEPNNTMAYEGKDATFTFTDLATAGYQWQVDTSRGFNDIDTTMGSYTFYKNVHSKTLLIPNVTIGMNNFKYRCIRYALNNCPDTTTAATLSVAPLSVPINALGSKIEIYPNPAGNQLKITAAENITNIEISDFTGKVLIECSSNSTIMNIDVSDLSPGIYLIKLNKQYVQKFIKS